ncbi:MAG TPA: P27 family phage terminase small subunit, partial [Gemmataceae bacterium]|nr:P27 family phage terminase small subunit [Gemmataceae bacterium]
MGARGPAPTPTKILKARGSWRGELNPREPRPEPGAPLCPKGFGKAEREVWRRVCRTLADMGLLTKADWAQLERYCRYLVRWRGCEEFIAQHGLTAPVISTDPASDH